MLIPIALSNEHAVLQETVRDILHERSDVRRAIDTQAGHDDVAWAQLVEMGLPALLIPESYGGSGLGPVESFLTFREMGRHLLASPYFATVALAANVIVHAATVDAAARLLPPVAAGTRTATVALCEDGGSWNPADVEMVAVAAGDHYRLSGTKRHVFDGGTAELVVVAAQADDGVAVFAVDRDQDGLRSEDLETLDLTRRQADLMLDSARATRLSPAGDATAAIQRGIEHATLALVAEQVGGAEQVSASALDYAKVRVQFGQPIGSFQAIKHKLADMAFEVERMISAGWHAATALADGDPDAGNAVHLAKAFCSEAYFRLTVDNIQIHGGTGFTWEHPAHLYFRRAKSSEFILGSPKEHSDELLRRLIDSTTERELDVAS